MNFNSPLVALEGFEPSQAEPESDVLPLHHKAIQNVILIGSLAVFVLRVQRYDIFWNWQIFTRKNLKFLFKFI